MNEAEAADLSLRSPDTPSARRSGKGRFSVAPENETTSDDGKVARRRDGPPTIGDVARLAGTSEATVSRALRGSRRVGEELRLSVVQAAEALDKASGGAVKRAIAGGRFAGQMGQVLDLIAPHGVDAARHCCSPEADSKTASSVPR